MFNLIVVTYLTNILLLLHFYYSIQHYIIRVLKNWAAVSLVDYRMKPGRQLTKN